MEPNQPGCTPGRVHGMPEGDIARTRCYVYL